jgi:iron complex transport system substrate-binding protein
MLMLRVVSLISSATEIVCALGCESMLVGRSHECDFPPGIRRLPSCTEPKFDIHRASREIDRDVKALLRDALSVYRVDADRLAELAPDVIITQAQCEVCAVSLRDVERAVCSWLRACPALVSLVPNALADVWSDIENVAGALGLADRGADLIAGLRARIDAIAQQARSVRTRPRVACIEWIDPLMAAGNWVPELVELAGGENLFGLAGKHSPWMTFEQLCESEPDMIVILPCGFDIERSRKELAPLTNQERWPELRAVKNNRVYLADGNQYFNRPGPRIVESLEILAEICHPDRFNFGHRGKGWEKLL